MRLGGREYSTISINCINFGHQIPNCSFPIYAKKKKNSIEKTVKYSVKITVQTVRWVQWPMSVIPATREAEARETQVIAEPRELSETPSQKNKIKWDGNVAQPWY